MRHDAVVVLGVLAAAASIACTEKLVLPGAGPRGLDGGATGGGSGSFGDGGDGPGGSFGGGDSRRSCDQIRLPMQRARMVFSVGKNASMTKSFGGGTRLSGVQQALQAVIQNYEYSVVFGYQDFPGTNFCPMGGAGGCCVGELIPPSSTAVSAIRGALECRNGAVSKGCEASSEFRPIGAALKAATPFFNPTDQVENFLVLIVDGDPSCASENAGDSCAAALGARAVLDATTVVVGVGQESATAPCLRSLAEQANRALQLPDDPDDLTSTLQKIVREAAAPYCFINLKTPTDRDTIELYISNTPVPRNAPNGGWGIVQNQPNPMLQIQVYGESCDQLKKTPSSEITVWGCAPAP